MKKTFYNAPQTEVMAMNAQSFLCASGETPQPKSFFDMGEAGNAVDAI